ncbi:uncharacterized protein F5891DRAFT_1197040 [Suillus fuscotomentosus]|uniref:Uncharacterized protein n=1 Tax=Suillus fuscotomentosus TaxID=1912939 RepID=A0AAD4HCV3_9AGAM|nr:uncharacterized protein F5891DRAFT_1197040 [Suillus fuscotomentosus]KAG1892935.1 hypothetical protein F5891DRAFT_1197040 [Suillus fuscotomentosus]
MGLSLFSEFSHLSLPLFPPPTMGKSKCLRVVLSDSSALNLSDYDSEIATPLVKPEVDSPLEPCWHTCHPNAGKGGAASQLRRAGEAVIDEPGRCTGKGRQFVIPDGELEKIMVPSPVKKRTCKKGKKSAVPAVTIPDQSDDAGFAPSLHVAEPGERFGLQKNPIPPGYVSLQCLWLEEHPECLKSRIQQNRPRSHTHTEVARRPAVEPPVICAPAIHEAQPTIPHLKPPVHKKLLGAGRAFPDSASSILRPVAVSENEETKHHSNKDMSEVDGGLNMVNDDKFPLSNDKMCTSPPVEFSLDRSADENEDIGHTQRRQGQAEQWVDHLGHASRKDDRQDRRKDCGEQSQPQTSRLHGASKQAHSNAIVEVEVPNVDYDVIKWHQKTNHHIWSPSLTYLHSVHHSGFMVKQPNTKRAHTSTLWSNNDHQAGVDSDGDMKVDSEVQHTSVGRHTKAAKNVQGSTVVAKQKTLGFFPDLWVKLLNYTKACFRLHLATADPFPAHEEALSDTGICLELVTELIQTALGDSEKVYRKLTNMLKQVADDEYHSEKLNEALRSWALAGMTGVVVDDEPQDLESDSNWVVELD